MLNEIENIKALKSEFSFFMYTAKNACAIIFSEATDKTVKCLAKLVKAQGHLQYAKAIYLLGITDKRDDIDSAIAQADTFMNEITRNIATDHSHQWTDIEFRTLVERYNNSVLCDKEFIVEE